MATWFMFGERSNERRPMCEQCSRHIVGVVLQSWLVASDDVFVSLRCRVTKVAPESFREANVGEQMSWDIMTKEKTLFENALDGANISWEEPVLDETHEFLNTEPPDSGRTDVSRRGGKFPSGR